MAIKSSMAYHRPLDFKTASRKDAERIFKTSSDRLSTAEARTFEDFIMHVLAEKCAEYNLPYQFHTGLLAGHYNNQAKSNPMLMSDFIKAHRETRFDLFHGGYPYVHEWATLAKNFPNVTADITWLPIISPEIARQLLHELIETVPGNKIMAFGGDSMTVEMAYGHSVMTRQVVARVLSEKIDEGYLGEDEAVVLARRMLRDNPASLYRLKIAENRA